MSYFLRGTMDFVISLKAPGSNQWNSFISGTLSDPNPYRFTTRTPPLEAFSGTATLAEEVEFSCINYYGMGCALHYLEPGFV